MTIGAIKKLYEGQYADVEIYVFAGKRKDHHIDFMNGANDAYEDSICDYFEADDFCLMDEEDYAAFCGNSCVDIDFEGFYGSKDARVLMIFMDHFWYDHPLGTEYGRPFDKLSLSSIGAVADYLHLGGALTYYEDDHELVLLDESEYGEYYRNNVTDENSRDEEVFGKCRTMDDFLHTLTEYSLKKFGFTQEQIRAIEGYRGGDVPWYVYVYNNCLYARQEKYDKENTRRISLKLNVKTDADILEWLERQPSKMGAVKEALRRAISEE